MKNFIVLSLVFMLLVFGCTQQTNANTPNTPAPVKEAPAAPGPAMAKADFSIDSPVAGSTVAPGTVVVKLTPMNFNVVAPGANVDGQGHFHLFLDDGTYIPCASTSCEVSNVGPGTHTIKVTVQQNDHSAYPNAPTKSVTFTVSAPINAAPVSSTPYDFEIVSPTTNSWVDRGTVTVTLNPKNFQVVAPGVNAAGQGHFHLFLNGGTYIPCASTTCTVPNVPPGQNMIKVTVQNNDHSGAVGAPTKTVSFYVK